MLIETTLKTVINKHKENIIVYRNNIKFDKLKPEQVIENYLTISVKLPNNASIFDWYIKELITNQSDILLIPSQDILNSLYDFNNDIYTDIPEDTFKSITERIVVSGKDLNEVNKDKKYKVIVMDYINTRYKVKLSSYIAKNFPNVELVLGIN